MSTFLTLPYALASSSSSTGMTGLDDMKQQAKGGRETFYNIISTSSFFGPSFLRIPETETASENRIKLRSGVEIRPMDSSAGHNRDALYHSSISSTEAQSTNEDASLKPGTSGKQSSNPSSSSPSSSSSSVKKRTISIPPGYHSMLAGAAAGLVSSVVTCPLDVIKTRLQAQVVRKGAAEYEGVKETAARIWRSAGVRGLYRGLGPTVLGYLPTWGIYFSVYDRVKEQLTPEDSNGSDHWGVHIVAAMTAGATGTIVTNPLWLIRTRFMAQATSTNSAERYTNTWIAFRSIYQTEGWRAFYKGLAPSLIGVTHVAVHFPLYEKMKAWAATEDGAPLSSKRILVCSALSKMVASVITYPHEVLRTRLQIQKRQRADKVAQIQKTTGASTAALEQGKQGLVDTIKSIAARDGWKGFYRGISINLVRTVPSSAVTMLTYELIMRRLTALSPPPVHHHAHDNIKT